MTNPVQSNAHQKVKFECIPEIKDATVVFDQSLSTSTSSQFAQRSGIDADGFPSTFLITPALVGCIAEGLL